jgi:hypothetical protein
MFTEQMHFTLRFNLAPEKVGITGDMPAAESGDA